MLEVRKHSYSNKAAILHIDRRKEFKKKLTEKNSDNKFVMVQRTSSHFDDRF